MPPRSPSETDHNTPPTQRRFPRKMVIASLVAIAIVAFLHWQIFFLNQTLNLDPGVPGVATFGLALILVLAWSGWAFFIARKRILGGLILAIPLLGLILFSPKLTGDMRIAGWTPRFWNTRAPLKTTNEIDEPNVDLKTTTPNDFPQFLGPHRNATIEGVTLDPDWKTSPPQLLWKHPIGQGWSAFAVVNQFAVTQEQREEQECVTCYELLSGKLRWIHATPRRHEDIMGWGKVGPRATPTLDQGRVYVTSATGVLECLDGKNGQLIWSADIPSLVGIQQIERTNGRGLKYTMEDSTLTWGRSGSPLIYHDLVIVTAGGPADASRSQPTTLIAFDKVTGKEKWRGGNRMIAYGSPSIAQVLGQPQIVLIAEDHAVGHDPRTGKELWSHPRPGASDGAANCSQVTPLSDNQLLLTKAYGLGGEVIQLTRSGDQLLVESVDANKRVTKTKFTNPVVDGEYAYSLSDGFLECVSLHPLRKKWKQRGPFGNGQLLRVGDYLLVHTEFGKLMLVAADPNEFRLLGMIDTIEGLCWNTFCMAGDLVLVRSDVEAACFRLPTR